MLKGIIALRYILLVAVIASAIGAVVMFCVGGARTLEALREVLLNRDYKPAIANILSATDAFIFGIVLLVFSTGITFGFVLELTAEEQKQLPNWMRVHGIKDLKQKLVEIIILYLIVDFATDWVDEKAVREWTFLVKPMAIVLLAGAMRILATPHDET